MTEQPSQLAKEAKGLQQSLKEVLKTRDPWDREIEFQRKNLRRLYNRLLLLHPYAKESKDVETLLWMQTSYQFISVYKQRITVLDRALHGSKPNQQGQGQPPQGRQQAHGPVEYRKLMQRFRQFLAEEEKFWTQLVVRLRRCYSLDEAQAGLRQLGIVSDADDTSSQAVQGSAEPSTPSSSNNSREHFQLPPEESTVATDTSSSSDREGRLSILSKALVCLGDIARYRELYNESGGRPRAGHEDAPPPRRGRNRRGGAAALDMIPRARNYSKATECYALAQQLVPREGNPSHQRAILASYQKDTFSSVYYYYRSLCVRQPYHTAAENLGSVLGRAVESWRTQGKKERQRFLSQGSPEALAPRMKVQFFKEDVVLLHALWKGGLRRMQSLAPRHADSLLEDFQSLVSERDLPIDTILETVVLAQGALWKHRMVRDSHSGRDAGSTSESPAIESSILAHVLGLFRVLLEVGSAAIAEAVRENVGGSDLAQSITAPFRRTLPAMRIASKWLRANASYVQEHRPTKGPPTLADNVEDDALAGAISAEEDLQFWRAYIEFANELQTAFPLERLPNVARPLREDVEMQGFLPLKKFAALAKTSECDVKEDTAGNLALSQDGRDPNQEQLMRIADLLKDAQALADADDLPIVLHDNRFAVRGAESVNYPPTSVPTFSTAAPFPGTHSTYRDIEPLNGDDAASIEEDAMTETSRDDPVGDAFRKALDGRSETSTDESVNADEEDEVVWNPQAFTSLAPIGTAPTVPTLESSPVRSPISPHAPPYTPRSAAVPPLHPQALGPFTPRGSGALSTQASLPSPGATATTAQDLLNNMGLPRRPSGGDVSRLPSHHHSASMSKAMQPQLLFGSGPPNLPGHSIWSTSLDHQAPPSTLQGAGGAGGPVSPIRLAHDVGAAQMLGPPPSSNVSDMSHLRWPSHSQTVHGHSAQNSMSSFTGSQHGVPLYTSSPQQPQFARNPSDGAHNNSMISPTYADAPGPGYDVFGLPKTPTSTLPAHQSHQRIGSFGLGMGMAQNGVPSYSPGAGFVAGHQRQHSSQFGMHPAPATQIYGTGNG